MKEFANLKRKDIPAVICMIIHILTELDRKTIRVSESMYALSDCAIGNVMKIIKAFITVYK